MIKCVIFDLDGTLLNTLEDLKNSTNYALMQFSFPPRNIDEIRSFVGNGVRKLIERAIPVDCDKDTTEKCLEIFKKHYAKNMYNCTAPFNGIVEILKNLKNKGVKIGVVSNKFDIAVKELCEKYFYDLVDISIGQSEFIPPKPMPNGVLEVMKTLGTDESSTIYVGDSDVDIETAKNSNLKCIGVTWGFRDRKTLSGADFIVDNPCDIINIIRSV